MPAAAEEDDSSDLPGSAAWEARYASRPAQAQQQQQRRPGEGEGEGRAPQPPPALPPGAPEPDWPQVVGMGYSMEGAALCYVFRYAVSVGAGPRLARQGQPLEGGEEEEEHVEL